MTHPPRQTGPNRTLVGVLAVLCLLAGLALWLFGGADDMLCALLIRMGLVLGPIWLVLPAAGRVAPRWNKLHWASLVGLVFVLALLVYRPLVLVPVFLVLFVLSMFSWGSPGK